MRIGLSAENKILRKMGNKTPVEKPQIASTHVAPETGAPRSPKSSSNKMKRKSPRQNEVIRDTLPEECARRLARWDAFSDMYGILSLADGEPVEVKSNRASVALSGALSQSSKTLSTERQPKIRRYFFIVLVQPLQNEENLGKEMRKVKHVICYQLLTGICIHYHTYPIGSERPAIWQNTYNSELEIVRACKERGVQSYPNFSALPFLIQAKSSRVKRPNSC